MIRYLARRLGHGLLILFGVSLLMFLLQQAAPGEFLSDVKLNSQISEDTVKALRAQYGLDQPVYRRYVRWMGSVLRGELGYSFAYNVPAGSLLWPRVLNTLLLSVPALILSWMIAIPLGVFSAAWRGGWLDRAFSAGTSFALALPDLLLALLAIILALRTHRFPVGGMHSINVQDLGAWERLKDMGWHLALPVAVVVLGSIAPILRQVRSSMIELMDSSFMRAAEGHGLRKATLLFRHALPAAANPLISLFGLSVAMLLSVGLLVEVVMSWPGMGPLLLESILARDLFVVIGAVMLSTLLLVIGNLLADMLLYLVDPRIRVQS
jgi:peptide/nickel transport system permease protein